MEDYYRKRAEEYEEIYYRSELVTQVEIKKIADAVKEKLKDRRVLEIACGTGYWTQVLSETAQTIVAIDIAQEMLEIAKRKQYRCPVSFLREDAYNLSFEDGLFDGGSANFWFSHVPRNKIGSFLQEFHRVLQSGSRVFMADNVYVPGLGGKLIARDCDENTYKLRILKNGSEHLILKNYFSIGELMEIFSRYAKEFRKGNIFYGNRYWYVFYELR